MWLTHKLTLQTRPSIILHSQHQQLPSRANPPRSLRLHVVLHHPHISGRPLTPTNSLGTSQCPTRSSLLTSHFCGCSSNALGHMGAVVHYSHKEQAGPLKFTSGFEVFLPGTRSHTLRGTSRANRADALWMSNHQVYSNLWTIPVCRRCLWRVY